MPPAPPSPTASLRPRLGADRTPVYGGRVIAESEEEYSNLHTTIMSPGLMDPGQPLSLPGGSVASGMEHGGHVGTYRIVQSTTAHLPFLQGLPDEHQMLEKVNVVNPTGQYSSIQEGGKLVRYAGGNLDGSGSGGLRRSIRDNCPIPIHGAVHGQLVRHQASLYHNQHQHASYIQSRGMHCSVECSALPVQGETITQSLHRSHSLPTRDPRISHHNSLGGDHSMHQQGRVQRDLSLLKGQENNLGPIQVIYSSQQQQQQQHMLPHHGVSSIISTDVMATQQSTHVLGVDSVRPLPIPPSSNSSLEGDIENGIVPSVTVSMGHVQVPKSVVPVQSIPFPPKRLGVEQPEILQSVPPALNKVVGMMDGSGICSKIGVDRDFEGGREHHLSVGAPKHFHTFSRQNDHHHASAQSSETLPGIPESLPVHFANRQAIALLADVHPRPLQRAISTTGTHAGFSYVQSPEPSQVPIKPASLPVDSSLIVQLRNSCKDGMPYSCEPPESIWYPIPHAGQKRREKPWNISDTQREERNFPQGDKAKIGNDMEDYHKRIMLDLEHPLCENDEILRPFGNPVATDDFFGEGFCLDSSLPVSGPFATARTPGTEPRSDSHNECQGLASSSQLEAPSSLHEACEGFSGAHFPQITSDQQDSHHQWQDKFLETEHVKGSHVSHDDFWESDEEDASPAMSLNLSLEGLQQVSDMHADSAYAGDIHEEILDERGEHICPEQEGSAEFSRGALEDDDDETTEEEDFNVEAVDGSVGLKCPRVFRSTCPPRIEHQRLARRIKSTATQIARPKPSRAGRGGQKQSAKSKKPGSRFVGLHAKKKLPSEINAFLASAGLGFSDDEPKCLPKAPPRFPRKMAVKREDVLQLAISMTGNPTASADEIQGICTWWMHQSEAETGAASRANVLRNWHGLKIASSFAEGSKGLAAIQKCMENDDRFVLCGLNSKHHDLWGVRDGVKGSAVGEEQRSDSDERTMYYTEQDDWRAKEEVFHTSASEVVGQKALVYQKAAEDEFKRRQDLQRLQNGLEPEGCSGQEKEPESAPVRMVSPTHKFPKQPTVLSEGQQPQCWPEPEDTQSLNNSPSRKRLRTNRGYLLRSCNKPIHGDSQSLIKHKTRSLSDVYAHGPKILTGNDSPMTLPDQELNSKACDGKVNSSEREVLMEFDGHTAEKESCYAISNWIHHSHSTYPADDAVGQELPADFLPEKLSESEQGNLLELLPDCECPDVFGNPGVYTTSTAHNAINTRLHRDGLLHQKSNSRLVNSQADLLPAALRQARFS